MAEKWTVILFFTAMVGSIWCLSMLSTPRKGLTRVLERIAAGAALCFLCSLMLVPFDVRIPQTPLSALIAGYFGLPGVVLSAFLSIWP